MDLLQQGVRRSVIALWLGHESVKSTEIYVEAALAISVRLVAFETYDGSISNKTCKKTDVVDTTPAAHHHHINLLFVDHLLHWALVQISIASEKQRVRGHLIERKELPSK